MRTKLDSLVGLLLLRDDIKDQYFYYQGKPFILDYVGTPSPFIEP